LNTERKRERGEGKAREGKGGALAPTTALGEREGEERGRGTAKKTLFRGSAKPRAGHSARKRRPPLAPTATCMRGLALPLRSANRRPGLGAGDPRGSPADEAFGGDSADGEPGSNAR